MFDSQARLLDGRLSQQYSHSARLRPPTMRSDPAIPAYAGRYAGPFLAMARAAAARHGVPEDLFLRLVQRESNWNPTAQNPSSGAYGIPQSLPGSKMASVGSDWRTNPATQITWGLNYISGRYGTPCGALAHSNSVGWY